MHCSRRSFFGKAVIGASALATVGLGAFQVHAESLSEKVTKEGTLVIGIHNRSPWGFKPEGSDEPTGWHPDLLREVFADLGVKHLDFRVTEFGALIPGLMAGRFDAIASGLSITPERCAQVAFGSPDLRVPDAAIVLSGNPMKIAGYADIAANGEVIMGAGRGSVVAKNAAAAGVPEDRMLLFPDVEANLSALRAGRIHVAIFSSPTVIGLMAGNGSTGLERALPFATDAKADNFAAIAFRKEDDDLRKLYDERLAKVKTDGRLDAIMKKYGFGAPERVPDGVTTADLCSGKTG